MAPKFKVEIKLLSEATLYRKFAIAFVFMSLVPIVLICYVINSVNITPLVEKQLAYFRLTILLVVLLSLASFDLVRRSMIALLRFAKTAKEISNGEIHKRVDVNQKNDVGLIAESFNKVTAQLEAKIKELQTSKELIQNILHKIGTAVTSTRGMDNLLELIIQSLVQGMDATSSAILLLDASENRLRMKVSFGMDNSLYNLEMNAEEGLIGRVLKFKRPESVSNVSGNVAGHFEYKNKLASDSIVAAPLLYKDRALGIILVSDKRTKDSFNSDDIILLSNVAAQTAVAIANYQLNEDAEKTYIETITALAIAVEAKDRYSKGHLDRVADYVDRVGRYMHLDDDMISALHSGAILHDIGKIGIRDEILKKTSQLSEDEEKEMKEHVAIGVNIIRPIRSMSTLCELVRYHHEFYDGLGYPDGLKGEEIPLTARILKVCDAYDAMTTDRPYRRGMSRDESLKELVKRSGTEFDPEIVEIFSKVI